MDTSTLVHCQWRKMMLCVGAAVTFLGCGLYLPGCAAYRFGADGLYPPHIRTVCVPVFKSDNLRPGMGAWLTEAVVKKNRAKYQLQSSQSRKRGYGTRRHGASHNEVSLCNNNQ